MGITVLLKKRTYQFIRSAQQELGVTGTVTVLGLIAIRIRIYILAFVECDPRVGNIPQLRSLASCCRNVFHLDLVAENVSSVAFFFNLFTWQLN